MAPKKKPRSMNKQLSSLNEISPEKDGVNSNKNKQRKKKLSDKLGSQWNKEELERFYEAYRTYGKDWKKVAAVVCSRSVERVKALYSMNREESDSERESNDVPGSQKPVKRKHGNIQHSVSKDSVQSQSIVSKDGCLSLLKRRQSDGSQARAVGKRTPRVPVNRSYKKDDRENYVLPDKRSQKSAFDANDDEVAHFAALALTKAAKRGGSPQVSQMPYKRSKQISSPVQSCERMHQDSETVPVKLYDASIDEECLEGLIESRGAEKREEYARDTSASLDLAGIATVEAHPRGKKIHRQKERVETVGNCLVHDGEACNDTEGLNCSFKEKVDVEFTDAKLTQFSPESQRKRRKKLFFGDESSALDALQTLAALSTMESESSVQLKEEKKTVDKDEKSALPEVPGVEASNSKESKRGRESMNNSNALLESKEQLPPAGRSLKRKRNFMISKVANAKLDSYPSEPLNNEAVDEENKLVIKEKHTDQFFTTAKQLKSVRSSESLLRNDQKDLRVSMSEIPLVSGVSPSTKQRSRHKTVLQRPFMPKKNSSEKMLKRKPNKYSTPVQNRELFLKEKLSRCLSSYMLRRWCMFEWFYSAIDYPWFFKREFMEYLNHVGLGNIPRLTRVERSVIKSSLGKPRRFSECFLREERQKLKQYRESVRKHYNELRAGTRHGLPADLGKPLYVRQRVVALHSKTREIHDGSVLTVDHDKYMVQFDRPELGVEFVMDIDCMPLNPSDNMPEALRWQIGAGNVPCMSKELQREVEKAPTFSSTLAKHEKGDVNHSVAQSKAAIIDQHCTQQAVCVQSCTVINDQTKEANIHALSELTRSLDKKESLLMELKSTNTDIMENQNDADCIKNSEAFKKHYAMVSNALLHLRQHNTHVGNSPPPWMKPQANFKILDGLPSMLDGSSVQELGSTVNEIIKGSRLRAHVMVDTAFQALSSIKEGEDAFMRIGQALDDHQQPSNSKSPVIRSQGQMNGNFYYHNQSICRSSEPLPNDQSSQKLHNDSDKVDNQIPLDLITSCVATLIMIQTCTERQYPPADVAQILDSAVTSLHPCSPRNLPIYREIQMCMGRIKTQILALIPT